MVYGITLGIVGCILVTFFIIWAVRYTKAGPNEVLIISGRKKRLRDQVVGYRIVQGGGTFVWPIKEQVQRMSLELMNLDVKTPEVYTVYGVPVAVDGVAQIKIKGNQESIIMAAEQFLSRSRDDIIRTALQVTEGHMRAIIGKTSIEDIFTKRNEFAQRVKEVADQDLSKMGLEIISLTIRNISDPRGYLEALGRPRTAQVKRDAVIGEAQADEEAKTFRYKADTTIDQARRDHEIKRAEFDADISQKRAEADLAYDLSKHRVEQSVKKEEIRVGIVEKEQSIELAEKETLRKERELVATVQKVADADRYRIQALADAEKYRLQSQAKGEAEVIRAKGSAEADTMHKKADAWSEYNQAAVTEMFVNVLPKMAEAVAMPLAKTDKIVVISGGDGGGTSRITKDVAQILSQVPAVVESLAGVKLEDLIKRVPGLKTEQETEV